MTKNLKEWVNSIPNKISIILIQIFYFTELMISLKRRNFPSIHQSMEIVLVILEEVLEVIVGLLEVTLLKAENLCFLVTLI
jgi:hypothetical protein